jgi:5-methylcytosine-specific restriction endonuclease McrA
MRICPLCSTEKAEESFASGRPKAYCKDCRDAINERRRARYATDPEARQRLLARNRARADANRDYERQRSREWHAANRDRAIKNARSKYWADPEAARAASLATYYKDKSVVINRNRATRVRAYGNDVYQVTVRDIERLFARCGNQCIECGSTDRLGVDHVIPVARGGRHAIGNLTVLCRACNSSKKDKTFTEWRKAKARRSDRKAS